MSNLCARCHQTRPMARMLTVVNVYRDGRRWLEICDGCVLLGDRVIDTTYDPDEEG